MFWSKVQGYMSQECCQSSFTPYFLETARFMGIQVIQYQLDVSGVFVLDHAVLPEEVSRILSFAVSGNGDRVFTLQWGNCHKQIPGAMAFVLVVSSFG